jgi:hypothetical protein
MLPFLESKLDVYIGVQMIRNQRDNAAQIWIDGDLGSLSAKLLEQ